MKPQRSKRIWLWVLPLLFMGLFFYYPLVSVFQRTSAGLAEEGLGSVNAARLIGRALRFTVFQSLLSTLLTLGVGLPAAYLFARFRFAGKRFLHVLITLPFILPTVVVASAFSALLGPNGWLNQVLKAVFDLPQPPIQFLNTLGAILLGHVFYNTAVIIRVVGSSWAQLDPRLENAARSLGASPLRAFLEVTLPLLRPAILAGSLLVFLFDFTSFGVILMLGGPQYATLEVEIYIQAMHMLNLPLAAVLSALQIACTLVLSAGYTRLTGAANIPLIPRLNQSTARFARTAAEKVFVGGMILFLLILLVLPLAALALRSVSVPGAETATWTLDYYRELFINRRAALFYVPPILAIRNSLLYGAGTVLISLLIGSLISYALERSSRLNRWLEPLIMLPLGTSAVTLGLGYILVFNGPVIDLRSFPLLIPIVHSLVALPMVVRTVQPALRSIPAHLRESAAILGAAPWQVWKEVDLPILTRAAVVAGIFSFTISLGEFGATSFLSRPEMPTMPTAIYRFLSQPGALNFGQAMAMSTLLMIVCAGGILLIEVFEQRLH